MEQVDNQGVQDEQNLDQQGSSAEPKWYETLDDSIKNDPSITKFGSVNDLGKSYIEAQKFIGKDKVVIPSENATDEERAQFYNKLGRPEEAAGYKFPEVELVEGMAIDPKMVENFQQAAHGMGLTQAQAEQLYAYQANMVKEQVIQGQQQNEELRQSTEAELRKEFGQAFDGNLNLAKQLLVKYGSDSLLQKIDGPMGNDPDLIKFVVDVAKNFGEDTAFAGEARVSTMTPAEAVAEINSIKAEAMKDPQHPYVNKSHPENKLMAEKMNKLYALAYPNPIQ